MRTPRWFITGHLPKPSQAEARREIESQIETIGNSHKEFDGRVRDATAIRQILNLQLAADLLRRSKRKTT